LLVFTGILIFVGGIYIYKYKFGLIKNITDSADTRSDTSISPIDTINSIMVHKIEQKKELYKDLLELKKRILTQTEKIESVGEKVESLIEQDPFL
jgi:hypothetical protein